MSAAIAFPPVDAPPPPPRAPAAPAVPYRYQIVNAVRADPKLPPHVKDVLYSVAISADLHTGLILGITARTYARHMSFAPRCGRRTAFSRWRLLREHGLLRRKHHYDATERHPDYPDGRANSFVLTYPGIALPFPVAVEPERRDDDPTLPRLVMPPGRPVNLPRPEGPHDQADAGAPPPRPGPPPAPSSSAPPPAPGVGTASNANVDELLEVLRRLPELRGVAYRAFAQRVWAAARSEAITLATASLALYQAAAKSPLEERGVRLDGIALERAVIAYVLAARERPVGDGAALVAALSLYPEELEVGGEYASAALPRAARDAGLPLPACLARVRARLDQALAAGEHGRELRKALLEVVRGAPAAAPPPGATSRHSALAVAQETPAQRGARLQGIARLQGMVDSGVFGAGWDQRGPPRPQ